ncbi:hypothetical protein E1285_35700 [Actinomadura sp. 7K507]|nr:hypothetical protein E1285_35700 [Actinomadura sp. 7K507]
MTPGSPATTEIIYVDPRSQTDHPNPPLDREGKRRLAVIRQVEKVTGNGALRPRMFGEIAGTGQRAAGRGVSAPVGVELREAEEGTLHYISFHGQTDSDQATDPVELGPAGGQPVAHELGVEKAPHGLDGRPATEEKPDCHDGTSA